MPLQVCVYDISAVLKWRNASPPGLPVPLCNDRLSSPSHQASIHAEDSPRLYSSQVPSMRTTHQSARRSTSQSACMINDNQELAAAGPVRGDFRGDGWWVCHTNTRCGLTAGTEKRTQCYQLRVAFVLLCSAQVKTPVCNRKVDVQQPWLFERRGREKANVNKRQNVVGMNSVVIIAEAAQKAKQQKHFP